MGVSSCFFFFFSGSEVGWLVFFFFLGWWLIGFPGWMFGWFVVCPGWLIRYIGSPGWLLESWLSWVVARQLLGCPGGFTRVLQGGCKTAVWVFWVVAGAFL